MGILAAIGIRKKVQFIMKQNTIIEFEASLAENHSRTSTPTEFPIEDGRIINDHIILKPFELSMTMIITDKPISGLTSIATEGATTLTAKLLPPIGTVALGAGLGGLSLLRGGNSPSVKAYNQIRDLQKMGEPFDVITSLSRYENMVISAMSVPREAANGECILVSISLTQLRIVSTNVVNVTAVADPGLAGELQKLGQQGTNKFEEGYKDEKELKDKLIGNKK